MTVAERRGFEPLVPFGYTRFPSVLLKPLGHLSGGRERIRQGRESVEFRGGSSPTTEGRPTAVGSAGFAGAHPPLSASVSPAHKMIF